MNKELKAIIEDSSRIVFFGGAGVSTESGIPDFRSKDGLYHQKGFKYEPEFMLSRTFFDTHTEEFFEFYRTKMIAPNDGPSAVHYKLAEMEKEGKLIVIRPTSTKGFSRLEHDQQKILNLYADGYNKGLEISDKIKDYFRNSQK